MVRFLKLITISLILLAGLFFLMKFAPSRSIEISSKNQSPQNKAGEINIFQSLQGTTANILFLGKPGAGYPGAELTDTIIITHLKENENVLTMISLPRDLLVKVPNKETFAKINSLYALSGIEPVKEKIKEIAGLPIDYYVIVDLTAIKEIVNLLDGLNVNVPQDIYDPYFPGPNYSYQPFVLKAGWRYLDGENILKYIRTRYTSPNGDFDRMARQQQIIKLAKQKIFSLNPLADFLTYLKIFNSLNKHIETDIGITKMKFFWEIIKNLDTDNLRAIVIDENNTSLLSGGQAAFGSQIASVVLPKIGQENYQEIREYIRERINK